MVRPLLDPTMAKGAFHINNTADHYPASKLPISDEAQKAVYDHFMEVSSKF